MTITADTLRRLNACKEARDWFAMQPDAKTAWSTCDRADWMVWLLVRLDRRRGVGVTVEVVRATCAHLAADEVTTDVLNPLAAWAAGDDSIDVSAVCNRAWVLWSSTANAADAAYAAYAANAANDAAAAYAANAAADWSTMQADMIRDLVPFAEVERMVRRWERG